MELLRTSFLVTEKNVVNNTHPNISNLQNKKIKNGIGKLGLKNLLQLCHKGVFGHFICNWFLDAKCM